MEVAEIAGQVSALIGYILSCEVTEVGDAIFECCPNVCARTDAVKMFGLETTEVRCTTRLAGLCSSRVGIPELSQDLRDFVTRVQIVVERVPR